MFSRFPRLTHLWRLLPLLAILLLAGCQSTQKSAASRTSTTKPIHVVTSLDFYGEVAQAVLGQHGTVDTIIKSASVDPHDFEPTPQNATTVSHATLVLGNGLGYDAWLGKLVASDRNAPKYLRVGEDVLGLKTGANEHVWYRPETMPKLATALAQQFGKQAPKYRAYYQKRAQAYQQQLKPLQRQIKQLQRSRQTQPVIASEPVFDTALQALGYQRISDRFEKAVENGTDPAPRDLQRLQTAIRHRKVAFLVNNQQASSPTVKQLVRLAKQSQVPVLNVTETKPQGQTYVEWMSQQYTNLARIQADQH